MDLIADAIGRTVPVVYEKSQYLAELDELLGRLRAADHAAGCVMIIGHNPGLQELAIALLRDDAKKTRAKLSEKFPTATIACFDVPIATWTALQPGEAALTKFVRPADLDD